MKIKYKNTLFSIFAIILIIFISEIFFTAFFVLRSPNYYGPISQLLFKSEISEKKVNVYKFKWDHLTQKMHPGTYKYNDKIEFKVNSRGFIGKEFKFENKSGCRIISFGGSTTAGVETNRSYPKILEEKFHNNNINCEVLNFGFSGKGLNFIENLLVNEAINYKPNIITIMSNRNAVMYDSFGNSSVSPDIIESRFDYIFYKINAFMFSKIMTYRFFQLSYKRTLSSLSNEEEKIIHPYNQKIFHLKNYFESKYINQMTNILNFCSQRKIKVVFIKQGYYINPNYQKVVNGMPEEHILEKLMTYHKRLDKNNTELFWIYTNAILNKALDRIKAENSNVIIVDPTIRLYQSEKESYFFNDGIHLKTEGNEIIADEINKSITESIDLSNFTF